MWQKPKMFCFTKILIQDFLHDSHIWLWGFFTLLVALAHAVAGGWAVDVSSRHLAIVILMMLEWYCTATSGYACHFNSLCFQPAGGQSLFSSCRTDERRGCGGGGDFKKWSSVLDQCSHICEKHREKKELLFSFSSQTKMNPRLKLFFERNRLATFGAVSEN